MHHYEFPRPALGADVVLFSGPDDDRYVLLIRRGLEPFQGTWALPGGFVDEGELVEVAARRELAEETGVEWDGILHQSGAYADPGRDPRGWTASIAFCGWAGELPLRAEAGDDAAEVAWHSLGHLPPLAFDHDTIISDAIEALRLRGEW
ncbi:MAG: NUDIX domain-containing protein [Coriobacteriia bacterium]